MNKFLFFAIALIINFIATTSASPKNLPVPRFVTIKFNEVNARAGPVADCTIDWVFIKKGEPVEIILEYEQWRKIRDISGEGGWVHSNVISGNRSVIITSKNTTPLLESPGKYDQIVALLEPKIRCALHKCKQDWCKLDCKSYKGWVAKKFLWGVYPEE